MAKALIINAFVITGHIAFLFLYKLEFAGEVETDFGEVALCHLEYIARIGEEYVASLAVESHKLVLAALEGFERVGIVALYPACLVEVNRLPAALCAILM